MPRPADKDDLTLLQAAKRAGVTVPEIETAIRDGGLLYWGVGSELVVPWWEVDRWVYERRKGKQR